MWDEGRDKRLTQLVFCDFSTPNADKFNVYEEVHDRLTDKGVPAREIAFIHDADTDAQKATMQSKAQQTVNANQGAAQ